MPYKSRAQEAYFNANRKKLESEGVNVDEWNHASKGMKLPDHVSKGTPVKPPKMQPMAPAPKSTKPLPKPQKAQYPKNAKPVAPVGKSQGPNAPTDDDGDEIINAMVSPKHPMTQASSKTKNIVPKKSVRKVAPLAPESTGAATGGLGLNGSLMGKVFQSRKGKP